LSRTLPAKANPAVRNLSRRTRQKPARLETWPSAAEWSEREQATTKARLRRLGVEETKTVENGLPASQVLSVLSKESFAEFPAVRTAGKVIWCNFELARQLGFSVPRSNQLTPEFHEQLLARLSYRAVRPAEDLNGQPTVSMYADKYGGDGLGPALGAGRAGFLAYGNLYVKGLGFTPLFRHDDPNDFAHSHGAVHLDDCLSEAVFGEVNQNLFTQGSARILAIIDEGRCVIPPSGRPIPVALVVRAGAQLRPAHLLTRLRDKRSLLEKFISIGRASGQLVTRYDPAAGKEFPDLTATMLRIVDDHARTSAEAFRWRMIHGALSASNMDISGAMLDLPTQSTQPRTAPVWYLDYTGSVYGSEHTERAVHLIPIHRKLMRNIPLSEWPQLNLKPLNIKGEMAKAYHEHLQVKLLCAAGLKTEVSTRIRAQHEQIASSFAGNLLKMASLKNRGSLCISKESSEYVSLLDVFNLLKSFPSAYFANRDADHTATVLNYLKPILRGNRFQIAKQQTVINGLVSEFASLYRDLMKACADQIPTYYGDLTSMQSSITARAAFENEPLDLLYTRKLYTGLRKAIASYRSTGKTDIVSDAIEQRIARSLRSVDGLLAQGESRRLNDGGVELEMQTIQGVNYSVRAWNDHEQTRCLHVSIPIEPKATQFFTGVPHLPRLTKRQIQSLRYYFTTDGGTNFAESTARLNFDEQHGLVIDFDDLHVFPLIGRLEGTFYVHEKNDRGSFSIDPLCFRGYTFAIPDKQELTSMVASLKQVL
jgi:hypothetical protein